MSTVTPSTGPFAGNNYVTIRGTNLGNGTDITNVELAGINARIVAQNTTMVTVIAAQTVFAGSGSVYVSSVHFGSSIWLSYLYNPGMSISNLDIILTCDSWCHCRCHPEFRTAVWN